MKLSWKVLGSISRMQNKKKLAWNTLTIQSQLWALHPAQSWIRKLMFSLFFLFSKLVLSAESWMPGPWVEETVVLTTQPCAFWDPSLATHPFATLIRPRAEQALARLFAGRFCPHASCNDTGSSDAGFVSCLIVPFWLFLHFEALYKLHEAEESRKEAVRQDTLIVLFLPVHPIPRSSCILNR